MKTWVFPFRRRNGFEWTIRSRSRWNGVRTGDGSSGSARPRVSYERTASGDSHSASSARMRSSNEVMPQRLGLLDRRGEQMRDRRAGEQNRKRDTDRAEPAGRERETADAAPTNAAELERRCAHSRHAQPELRCEVEPPCAACECPPAREKREERRR